MYAVIFKAKINKLDDHYSEIAQQMRELAISRYNCIEFTSITEGTDEISISYWKDQKDIKQWKQNAKHLAAQKLGKSKYYKSYQVQITEVIREYRKS